ncbi:4'-phosphopantetheinyl transferase superfamily protein [Fulvivirga sp. 29W222]|uniref:4'-phosphopantetheinyl transferase superfamily protein n=1 Tax=Fulvivirga marina TaxID=2494733 RepID=A0A937FW11_9BACT|nr:4'-phosphopantetheinyl transferase superfamily protein [Fulvivirga marina]MBL6446017.1 4'-phosphopantetheinyl transferase superfamily protein [Fulvivirga marina]
MIDIYTTTFKEPLKPAVFSEYLSRLPSDLIEMNSRYLRWQNRHAHLLGRLLLVEALKAYGIESNIWNSIKYNEYKRPYLTLNEYDFNISHSGDFVTCAIGKNIRLGIDIEENRKVNLKHFRNIMTLGQWDEINSASAPLKVFYKYWTIKESVIKADGRGFYIPLDELEVEQNSVQFEDKLWFVKEIEFANGYSASLATDQPSSFKMHYIDFYEPGTASQTKPKLVQHK